jgi:hypothetical protein
MAALVLHRVPLSVSEQRVMFSGRGGQVVLRATAAGTTDIIVAPGMPAQPHQAGCWLILTGRRDA